MKKGILIGIAGASGSGKTLVARTIIESLGEKKAIMIQEDSYYKDLTDIPYDDRAGKNFDHPDAFDHHLLIRQLSELAGGMAISHPVYDYSTHSRTTETRRIDAHTIVILEGILILAEPALRDLLDIKIFIDTPLDTCFIRRLRRDIHERGRSVDSVIQQYTDTVRPMYLQFIEPSKRYADIIIPRGGKNLIAIDIITAKIRALLSDFEN